MSLFSKNNTREKHSPSVLFRTIYGVVNIIDPDSIKRFQNKCGLITDGKVGHMTKAAIKCLLINPSDIDALDKAIPIRTRQNSRLSQYEVDNLVERLIRESGFF